MRIGDLVEEIYKAVKSLSESRSKVGELLDEINSSIDRGEIKIDDHVMHDSIWNNLGLSFYFEKAFLDMHGVYSHMSNTIQQVESKEKRNIHNGLALFNMGIAQTNLGNVEEGITNILRALEEDNKTFGKAAASMPASKLLEDYIANIAKDISTNYINDIQKGLKNPLNDPIRIVKVLDLGEQLFLSRILRSRSISFLGDINSRTTLFDALRDLCLLIEVVLRRKSGRANMLGGLIINIFNSKPWIANTNFIQILDNGNTTSASTPQDFEQNLKAISTSLYGQDSERNFLMKIFLACLLVRNFTSHHFDLNITLLTSKNEYDSVFKQVMYSLIYCLNNYV